MQPNKLDASLIDRFNYRHNDVIDIPELDRLLKQIDFSFMASCPSDFDCLQTTVCPPPALQQLLLDYEAKDYASFLRLMLDLLPQLNPNAVERNPSDLNIALIELLAYTGDRLSYFQDAVANEAYLSTVRHRISARRLAKLIDYKMHDGRNAWSYVHVCVNGAFNLPQGSKIVSRITAPLAGDAAPPSQVIDGAKITADSLGTDPALASTVVFETTFSQDLPQEQPDCHPHLGQRRMLSSCRKHRGIPLHHPTQ